MNTPAHLIFGAAAFARPNDWKINCAAILGAFAPDASLYAMAGWHLRVLGTPPEVVFRELYYSDAWQSVFAVDNSFFVWGALLALALYFRRSAGIAFAGAGLLHLALDFPLHHDDGRMHFWPVSTWVFESPVSYWDRAHYGDIIGPIEIAVSLLLLGLLWRRFRSAIARGLLLLAACFQIAPVFFWLLVFDG
ncbi:cobalamin biosynthesis protein CobQ [Litoreibacter roseus]|uniref:Cobalamin biosynthesis protein CobQ n=1 Tax=Litoreibacter roseus TaxID=2601869 RepID=A0A6N6JBB3_9RHOB|nr:cobalamin biosynthesis protein CobQ [Litoreibacter roseus]GFE63426.1 hypothetical protein KIN_05000 [Litoreibacter roseus]